jgi:cyclophilin family peptidyl-prolyl cis-trans isomerase
MQATKNKYCFFDLACEGKQYDRILIELFYNDCPKTSSNFLELCNGKNKNKMGEKLTYEGTIINRIVKNGYVQGGDLKRIGVSNQNQYFNVSFL